jgi:hypothetical protein
VGREPDPRDHLVAHALDRNDLRRALANQRHHVGVDAAGDLGARHAHRVRIAVAALAGGALARQRHRQRDRGVDERRAGRPREQVRVRDPSALDRAQQLRDRALLACESRPDGHASR